jgi:hypothetical protein
MAKLTADQYREALVLTLAELEDLPADRYERAQRLGRLKAHLATITDTGNPDAVHGLAALRRVRTEGP